MRWRVRRRKCSQSWGSRWVSRWGSLACRDPVGSLEVEKGRMGTGDEQNKWHGIQARGDLLHSRRLLWSVTNTLSGGTETHLLCRKNMEAACRLVWHPICCAEPSRFYTFHSCVVQRWCYINRGETRCVKPLGAPRCTFVYNPVRMERWVVVSTYWISPGQAKLVLSIWPFPRSGVNVKSRVKRLKILPLLLPVIKNVADALYWASTSRMWLV